eukprot:Skav220148  [mRNA]  locus=scaffold6329:1397:5366:- [translate_table: standard]
MYASALGVPSLVSGEHVLRTDVGDRTGVDGYLLTSQTSLPHFFEHLNTSELLPVGLAARESQRRFSMEAAPARVSFLLDSIQSSKPKNAGGMENVLLAANTSRSVDLFVITTSEDSAAQLRSLTSGLKANFATLRHVVVALGVNKGADIGLFLQQLLLNLEMQLEVDVIFKLHSKRKDWGRREPLGLDWLQRFGGPGGDDKVAGNSYKLQVSSAEALDHLRRLLLLDARLTRDERLAEGRDPRGAPDPGTVGQLFHGLR